jgi:hypothetical protein
LDQSRELDAKRGQYYQSLIGVLRWICELGRIGDVLVAVSLDALSLRCFASRMAVATTVSYLCIFGTPQEIENGLRWHRQAGIQRKFIQDLRLV